MTTFVGAEYIIANLLIAFKNENKNTISLSELSEAEIYIQQQSLSENLNAIFLISSEQVLSAIHDFSDYFCFNSESNSISIARGKNIADLESRFIGYLPFDVVCFLVNVSIKFAKHMRSQPDARPFNIDLDIKNQKQKKLERL